MNFLGSVECRSAKLRLARAQFQSSKKLRLTLDTIALSSVTQIIRKADWDLHSTKNASIREPREIRSLRGNPSKRRQPINPDQAAPALSITSAMRMVVDDCNP